MCWVVGVMVGCLAPLPMVWTFADIANGLMAVPNLISLLALSGVLVSETRFYLWENHLNEDEKA
jgi:alanine or glycine:cation symporter, AGCS family